MKWSVDNKMSKHLSNSNFKMQVLHSLMHFEVSTLQFVSLLFVMVTLYEVSK